MIRMNDVVTLICGKVVKDAEGYPTLSIISESEVFADVSSVKRQQKDSAYRRGYNASLTVRLYRNEFCDENYLEFDGRKYEIKDTYNLDLDVIELTCSDARC